MIPASSPASRIYQGETIAGLAWSSSLLTLSGRFRILYDDGTDDEFSINSTTLTNNRTKVALLTKRVARHDGYVVTAAVYIENQDVVITANKRGSCYVQVGITGQDTRGGSNAEPMPLLRTCLCCGPIYSGHTLQLGESVEPGPAGGPGSIIRVSPAAVAGGGSARLVLGVVPTGAMWRWIYGNGTYTASATIGSRLVFLRFRDASGNQFAKAIGITLTAGQNGLYEFAPNLTSE